MIEKEIQQFFQIYARFDALKTFPNEKLGLLPLTTSKAGGSILFVTRRGISQETIAQIMDRLRHQYRTVTLKYASRRDGICTHGLQINQCLSQDIYSPYVMPGAVVFVGGDGRRYIAPHQEVMQRENTGVLLDHVYGKVYVEGHKATYKQLRSQS